MRMARLIEPRGLVESDHVDHERIVLPSSDGISQEGRIGILWMRPAVRVNRAPDVRAALKDEQHAVAQLKDLKGKRRGHQTRNPRRQTSRLRIVLLKIPLTLFVDPFGPGLKRDDNRLFDWRSIGIADAGQVGDHARIPHAFAISKIRTAVRQAGCWTSGASGGFGALL